VHPRGGFDDERNDAPRRPARSRRRTGTHVFAILAALAVLLAGALLWYRDRPRPPPAPAPPRAEAPPAAPAAPASAAPQRPPDLGPDATPEQVRSLLEGASADPTYRSALAHKDPVRRWAVVTDNLAEGVSPRKQLSFLAPRQPFTTVSRGGKTVISPASYARYDAIGDAVASLDARALAAAYWQAHAAVEAAYRALGYPGASLDAVTARALRRIAAAPVPEGDVAVVDEFGVYTFADPRLEALGPVEKHLVRMGPRNARNLQAKARELLEALQLPAPASAR
jgi:hypothetical protein